MLLKTCLPVLLCLPLCLPAKGDPPVDNSKADTDGPFVFYRGKNRIEIKSIELRDTQALVNTRTFSNRRDVLLNCGVPASSDYFTFGLHDSLTIPEWDYAMPDKLLVLSDIEGNFQAFKALLTGAKVIDDQFNWIYGKGHLVLLGDFFDRGLNVTECLWLIYKLEAEAQRSGGTVHFILGNHEILNLEGNTQYVRNKYRENAALLNIQVADLYSVHTELGQWLRSRNAVERIGDYVFCHGGISPKIVETGLSLFEINDIARLHYGVAEKFISDPRAKEIFNVRTGIFWFRDAARNRLPETEIDEVLAYAGANHMVVGHTLVPDILPLYNGKVLCVDLYHDENLRLGQLKTLYLEKGHPYILDSKGAKSSLYTLLITKGEN